MNKVNFDVIVKIGSILGGVIKFIFGLFRKPSSDIEEANEKANEARNKQLEAEKELIQKEVEDEIEELEKEDPEDFFKRTKY